MLDYPLMIGILESDEYLGKSSDDVLKMALDGEISLYVNIDVIPPETAFLKDVCENHYGDVETGISYKYKKFQSYELKTEDIQNVLHDGVATIDVSYERITNGGKKIRFRENGYQFCSRPPVKFEFTIDDIMFLNPKVKINEPIEELSRISKEGNYGWQKKFILETATEEWNANYRIKRRKMADVIKRKIDDHFEQYPEQHMRKNNTPYSPMARSGIINFLREAFPDNE